MARNRIALALLAGIVLFSGSDILLGAGGVRFRAGRLSRLWENQLLPTGTDEAERVHHFLLQNRELLGLSASQQVEIKIESMTAMALGERFVYSQYAYGRPVFDAQLVIVASGDSLKSLCNGLSTFNYIELAPSFSPESALQQALLQTGTRDLRLPAEVVLGYDMVGALIYRVRIASADPPIPWEVRINAVNGELISTRDLRLFVDGTGSIFDPDPKTALEDNTLQDMGDANAAIPLEAYSAVVLRELYPAVGGYFYLDGPFASTAPTASRAREVTPDFNYLREDDRFEEVMAYYQIDREQRYFQDSLETYNANNRQQACNVNGTPADNSWFDPMSRTITYGYGGVDDAEDADVIVHEYGHAVQSDINPYWGYLGHTGAMGEGFGDYLAGSYSLSLNQTFQPDWVYNWDGHNEFWGGRILNANYHYPENANGEIHDSGQLWSAGLIDVWWDIPDRIAWDRIVLQHHFLLSYDALMEDAAEAILVMELALYNGQFRAIIVDNFGERGFINPLDYYPVIVHEPLPDTEDTTQAQFEIVADITSFTPLDLNSLNLFWRVGEEPILQQTMTATGLPEQYHSFITGPFSSQTISYYLTAADTTGMAAFAPPEAPAQSYQFYVGPDQYPPQVTWTDSLGETVFISDSRQVLATAQDNMGISAAELLWQAGSGDWQSTPMTSVAADSFQGTLTYANASFGDVIYYKVRVTDSSSQQNVTDGTTQAFLVAASAELDDFEGFLGPWNFSGSWGITNQFACSVPYSLEDSPGLLYAPNSDTWAQWGESWDLTNFLRARLIFNEMHLLEQDHDWGRLEVSADGGPWQSLLEVTGMDNQWFLREIPLDQFCGGATTNLRFRFRVTTDAEVALFGWFIDDLSVSAEVIVPVASEETGAALPTAYALGPVHPNPFNASSAIRFDLPQAGEISLQIYNAQGQLVKTLTSGWFAAGSHQIAFEGANLSSGLYLCRMQAGSYVAVEKLILLK